MKYSHFLIFFYCENPLRLKSVAVLLIIFLKAGTTGKKLQAMFCGKSLHKKKKNIRSKENIY